MLESGQLRERLAHVLWIGGPPDCGKTSIADLLAERHGLQVYHFDRHEPAHFARADPERTPALYRAHPDRMTTEMRWLGSLPDEMAADTIASWGERFPMAIEEILAMPKDQSIVAEGPGFFPDCLAPILKDSRQAVWLIPSDEFKVASAIRRNKPGTRFETSDPERAQRNLIDAISIMGEAHAAQRGEARIHGLRGGWFARSNGRARGHRSPFRTPFAYEQHVDEDG